MVRVKLLDVGDPSMPTKGSKQAAGWDLYAAKGCKIAPGCWETILTGIAVALPLGCHMDIRSRSGMAMRDGIWAFPGLIDSDYRGEIKVLLMNFGKKVYEVNRGDRIAQAVVSTGAELKEVKELPSSKRGEKGFGSTGR